jgi:Na+-transporting NADH:ubiquinone oxidoreductase subunit NqrB
VGYAIGAFWLILLAAFLLGFKKRISYGLVFVLHAGAILVALPFYIVGTENFNQLFLAAIPAAAAMGLLYVLRDHDTLLSLK